MSGIYKFISGGAEGADFEFSKYFPTTHLYSHLKKSPHGNEEITFTEFHESLTYINLAKNHLNRQPYLQYMTRDYVIAKRSDILVGVGYRDKGSDYYNGGTGWTQLFGRMLGKFTVMYNQRLNYWEFFSDNKIWETNDHMYEGLYNCFSTLEHKNIGVFGSRKLTEIGKKEIENFCIILKKIEKEKNESHT